MSKNETHLDYKQTNNFIKLNKKNIQKHSFKLHYNK